MHSYTRHYMFSDLKSKNIYKSPYLSSRIVATLIDLALFKYLVNKRNVHKINVIT